MKNVTRSLVLILAVPFLGACQTERMLAKCPTTAVLAEASSLTSFTPGQKMVPANMVYRIDARKVTTACSVDKDTHTSDSSLEISFRGYRPKGGGPAEYTVPFFVVVNDSDGSLIEKKNYSAKLIFQSGQSQVDFTQPIESFPIKATHSKQAFDYHLIVGMQLTKQQLDYNRKTDRYAE
ncbi:MAG TPA: hypothetical protein VGM36_10070 [Rhizomicrobium sp.]|jgi:hypothetical protein